MNNLPRYLILAALAVVGYLLLNAWRNDYVQPAASVPEITQPQNQGTDVGAVEQPASPAMRMTAERALFIRLLLMAADGRGAARFCGALP